MLKNRLSVVDKLILKEILSPNENMTSALLSKKLKIPVTTIQKSRKRLEKDFLELEYSLLFEKVGWRRVDFFISTISGMTDDVANKILALKQVIYVGKSIGEHTIDLRVEAIVKDNSQILDLMERMKRIHGVRQVVWSEIVKLMKNKLSVPSYIIDRL